VLPWVKVEGIILWAVAMSTALLSGMRRREIIRAALPGLLVFTAWQLFLRGMHTVASPDNVPVTLENFFGRVHRTGPIAALLFLRLSDWSRWSILWPLAAAALLSLACRHDRRALPLAVAIVLPIAIYCGSYIFSAWPQLSVHVNTSLPRLLIHVSLPALLAIVLAVPEPAGKK